MHAIEKILARASGQSCVRTGQIVNCTVDRAGINDLYLQTKRSFLEMGGVKVAHPENVCMFMDHYAPPSTLSQATVQKEFREFCREQQIGHLMDVNRGVCHQVLIDSGLSEPGLVIVITDSHTTTHGALGAFGGNRLSDDFAHRKTLVPCPGNSSDYFKWKVATRCLCQGCDFENHRNT